MSRHYLIVAGAGIGVRQESLRNRLGDRVRACRVGRDILLFTDAHTPTIEMASVDGWIVGELFAERGRLPVRRLASAEQLAIASTAGSHLIGRWSGRYLAVWRDHGRGRLCLLRDPSGFQRVYISESERTLYVSSDPALIAAAAGMTVAIDWDTIARHLLFPDLPSSETCLSGITELLAGELFVDEHPEPLRETKWLPFRFFKPNVANDADVAADLADTIDGCVAGWTARRQRLLLEMSGGLDSSILAAALCHAEADWSGLTVATTSADGDERGFARAVAAHLGINLEERFLDLDVVDLLAGPVSLTARPTWTSAHRGFGAVVTEVADEVGAMSLISGTGGDNIFCSLGSSAPVLDALRWRGLKAARQATADIATVTATTRGQVARKSARRAVSALRRKRRWSADRRFLDRDITVPVRQHPWLDLAWPEPQGLWGQIAAVLRAQQVIHAHDRSRTHDLIFPLLSQPVMERCFAIPSWRWVAGGHDRAVAREAYAHRLPYDIVARRGKGQLTGAMARTFDLHRSRLRELLCSGLLAEKGMLDISAVRYCLAAPTDRVRLDWYRLLELADAELWARRVTAR